jgi:hypothetical protein
MSVNLGQMWLLLVFIFAAYLKSDLPSIEPVNAHITM